MSIYEDIMHLTRPISSHPRMHREDRAKLFAPFAALNGHSRAIHQRDAVLVPQVQKTDDALEELDRVLQTLQKGDVVTITWFVPLQREADEVLGAYTTTADSYERLDRYERLLYLQNQVIPIDHLAELRKEDGQNEQR